MFDMPNTPAKINAYALHKSLGLTLLVLVAIRVAWRLFAGAPRPVRGTPAWQKRIASLTHVGLYVLLLDVLIPLAGANTKSPERDSTLKSADFFNVAKFAQARYTASGFRSLGGNEYAADSTRVTFDPAS